MLEQLKKYNLDVDAQAVRQAVSQIQEQAQNDASLHSAETLTRIFSLIDLTSLNVTDTRSQIRDMATKISVFQRVFPSLPNVAAMCVYPYLVTEAKKHLDAPGVGIAAVGAGFPASQTFFDVKTLECKRCVVEGATEVDVVISLGEFMEGNLEYVFHEIEAEKEAVEDAHLKVILETGSMTDLRQVRTASLLAMEAGADFIKTSTGKQGVAATPEAVYVMCQAIADFMLHKPRVVGIKPAGGISKPDEAIVYYAIVKEVLGDAWLNNSRFRFGASRLANNLLSAIATAQAGTPQTVDYF